MTPSQSRGPPRHASQGRRDIDSAAARPLPV
eukprot:CAMPEP_0170642550 /NCGR_PEP_ID=MMETSP0224-20130122/41389_1 /TAXON_ID=285029 /ORGANISM="Togula jolla, Strain CCCM 725" /LENGTH=30 /DNA_ID= /DNA_START= /DNA_END= /DNA_ORIENTATION=